MSAVIENNFFNEKRKETRSVFKEKVQTKASAYSKAPVKTRSIAWMLLEMQNLRPSPHLRNQNLHFNQAPGDSYGCWSLKNVLCLQSRLRSPKHVGWKENKVFWNKGNQSRFCGNSSQLWQKLHVNQVSRKETREQDWTDSAWDYKIKWRESSGTKLEKSRF